LLGLAGALFGVLELGGAWMGHAWQERTKIPIEQIRPKERTEEDSKALVYLEWMELNCEVHLLLGGALILSGIGLAMMREWGRRGMVLHALLSAFWSTGFALVSTTWVVATWDTAWEPSDDGGVVNMGGLAAFGIGVAALLWLLLSLAVLWILSRPRTRDALRLHDRGLSETPGG